MNTWARANKVSEQPGKIKSAVCPVIKRKQMRYKSKLLFDKSACRTKPKPEDERPDSAVRPSPRRHKCFSTCGSLGRCGASQQEKPPDFRPPQRALSVKLIFCRIPSSSPARPQPLLVFIHSSEPCERSRRRALNVRVNHFLNI